MRQRKMTAALAFLVAISCEPTNADVPLAGITIPGSGLFMTGPELNDHCGGSTGTEQTANTFAGGSCLGYITGVAEALLLYKVICYHDVTRGQLSDIVVKYMNEHPEEVRRYVGLVLVGRALKAVYPVTAKCEAGTK